METIDRWRHHGVKEVPEAGAGCVLVAVICRIVVGSREVRGVWLYHTLLGTRGGM